MAYAKLFASIVHSTIWREANHVRLVWITMLAIADKKGIVEASVPGLADVARVTLDECIEALAKLEAPDDWSRSKLHEGRRIVEVDGGWHIINYAAYRDRMTADVVRQQTANRVERLREKRKKPNATHSGNAKKAAVTHTAPDPSPDPAPDHRSEQSARARACDPGEEKIRAAILRQPIANRIHDPIALASGWYGKALAKYPGGPGLDEAIEAACIAIDEAGEQLDAELSVSGGIQQAEIAKRFVGYVRQALIRGKRVVAEGARRREDVAHQTVPHEQSGCVARKVPVSPPKPERKLIPAPPRVVVEPSAEDAPERQPGALAAGSDT